MTRNHPPSFDFYPDDFLGGTVGMHPLARGIYISLLCHQWSHGSIPNPANIRQYVQITGAMPDELEEHLSDVLRKFEQREDGLLVNNRIEKEYRKKIEIREKRVVSGKAGANAKQMLSKCLSKRGSKKQANLEVGSRKKEVPKEEKTVSLPFSSSEFQEAWQDFEAMRTEIKKPISPTAMKASLKKLEEIGEARSIAALRHTTANQWQGIREPDQPSTKPTQQTFAQQRLQNSQRAMEDFINAGN